MRMNLLNQILKHDWGFDGVVISDWGGCHNTEEAVTNGLDLEFGTWTDGLTMGRTNAYDSYFMAEAYKRLIREGRFTTKELDEKVRRVLRLFYRTTMNRHKPYGFLCSEAHYDAARNIAQEGIVLLKNKAPLSSPEGDTSPLLPLTTEKLQALHNARKTNEAPSGAVGGASILVVGENAIKMMTVGGGSSSLKVQRDILPLDGIVSKLSTLNSKLSIDYARGYVGDTIQSFDGVTVGRSLRETRSQAELTAEAVEKARQADVVIFFGGLNKADYQDSEGHDRKQYGLPYGQDELIEALVQANPNLVYVNISGNAVAMPWANKVPAILQAWFLGSEAGNAIADVLFGDVNPSGKLPYTWFQRLEDCGAHALNAFPGEWRDGHRVIDEEYKEGIFVGYRWADLPAKVKRSMFNVQCPAPLFAFGHGLSYTTFAIERAVADKKEMTVDEAITFTVSVKNTGSREGATTVQLYVSDRKCSLPRPVKELKAFQKVSLQPGEVRDVQLTIDRRALSFYDDRSQQWTAEPGDFEALIGFASDNIVIRQGFKLK